jgi:hypothetical protein
MGCQFYTFWNLKKKTFFSELFSHMSQSFKSLASRSPTQNYLANKKPFGSKNNKKQMSRQFYTFWNLKKNLYDKDIWRESTFNQLRGFLQ